MYHIDIFKILVTFMLYVLTMLTVLYQLLLRIEKLQKC